jgi:hypothetical protein
MPGPLGKLSGTIIKIIPGPAQTAIENGENKKP